MDKRRASVLQEMGVTRWVQRGARTAAPAQVEPVTQEPAHERAVPPRPTTDSRPRPRPEVRPEPVAASAAPAVADPRADTWETLRQRVAQCTACALHETRTQTVFGVGDFNADWMVVGEAPGQEEDRRGEPFVGRAGQLLDAMLLAAGFPREQVFIANILKCRPPNNRDPRPEEVTACSGYLKKQIEWVAPKIILAVGRHSAQNLLGSDAPIGKLRGKVHRHAETGTPVVVTYHPAYLLRQPLEKRKAWEDLKLALRLAAGEAA